MSIMDIFKANKHLLTLNICLDIILIGLCVYGTIAGMKVQPWLLGLFVFLTLMNNIEKLEKYQ